MYFGSEPNNVGPDVNFTPMRNVFPGADGGTIATLAAAGSPDSYGGAANAALAMLALKDRFLA